MNRLSLLFQEPLLFFILLVVFLAALSVHEASHALVGYLLGDQTAKREGRLTLNPLSHVDPLGLLLLITVGFGWGKPVPFNPYNLQYPRLGPVLVAGAGPAANLLFGIVCALVYRLVGPTLGEGNLLTLILLYAGQLNFLLMLFNLIPLPPLDGSKALIAVLEHSGKIAAKQFVETQGPTILLVLVFVDLFSSVGVFSQLGVASSFFFSFFAGV